MLACALRLNDGSAFYAHGTRFASPAMILSFMSVEQSIRLTQLCAEDLHPSTALLLQHLMAAFAAVLIRDCRMPWCDRMAVEVACLSFGGRLRDALRRQLNRRVLLLNNNSSRPTDGRSQKSKT